ncbi:MAG: MobH family relaxase [Candidatus Paceibacterota bacterium]|jgi:integrating conjugative element relaxase (TIGR03760 family)
MLLNFFQRDKTPAPLALATSLPPPPNSLPVLSAAALLQPRVAAINRIEELAGVPAPHFTAFYLAALQQYASFVQQLPASETHHHAHAGGLLDHTLEVLSSALSLRQGYLLPPDTAVESLVHRKDVWTYAVFAAALCHDLAKPAVDQQVSLFDAQGQPLGLWDPWAGNLDPHGQAAWYTLAFVRNRSYRLHEKAALLFAPRIIPAAALAWLASDPAALSAWCACVTGDGVQAAVLGEIISLADRQSVGQNLGAEVGPKAATTQVTPLHEKLLQALMHLLEEHTLPLNRNGAAGWRVGSKLWLVSKRTVDSIRLHLGQYGHTGIPTDNQRLFDILQEQQLLEPNQDRAIWRMTVQGDNFSHDLSLLCIPLSKLWPDPEAWPDEFAGTVSAKPGGHRDDAAVAETGSQASVAPKQNLDNPPALGQGTNVSGGHTTKTGKALTKPESTQDPPTLQNQPLGQQFLTWLVTGLSDRTIRYNEPGARVHAVQEGVVLVSPGIFKDFAQEHPEGGPWEAVQKKFLKLNLHERTKSGLNVHAYRISGSNHSASIMALLVKDTALLFRRGMPSANPHVINAS